MRSWTCAVLNLCDWVIKSFDWRLGMLVKFDCDWKISCLWDLTRFYDKMSYVILNWASEACYKFVSRGSQIAKFMGPTWGPPGSCRPQMGPMLAPWTLLSGMPWVHINLWVSDKGLCGQGHGSEYIDWVESLHVNTWQLIIISTLSPKQSGWHFV